MCVSNSCTLTKAGSAPACHVHECRADLRQTHTHIHLHTHTQTHTHTHNIKMQVTIKSRCQKKHLEYRILTQQVGQSIAQKVPLLPLERNLRQAKEIQVQFRACSHTHVTCMHVHTRMPWNSGKPSRHLCHLSLCPEPPCLYVFPLTLACPNSLFATHLAQTATASRGP